MQNIVFGNRTFQLWEFHTTHGFLVIRSPKSDKVDTNIDIICIGTEYLAIPIFLKNITIMEATLEEVKNMEDILGKPMENNEPSNLSKYSHEEMIDYKNIVDKFLRAYKSTLIIEAQGKRFPVVLSFYNIKEHQKDTTYSPFQEYLYGQ